MGSRKWKKFKLEELCINVTSGGTPSTQKSEYYGGTIPWLKTQEINFNRIRNTQTKITELGLNNSSAKWIPENSVIIAMYGATAGKSAINKIPLTTNQACCNLIINNKVADYQFVYYNIVSRFSEIASMATGGAQQNINAGMIRELEIYTPSLTIQKNIATILASLDDKIELNRQMNQTLEAIAQAIYKEWFVDFNFPGANGEMQDSELGQIPKGWQVGKLGDYVKTILGGTPSTGNKSFWENGTIGWINSGKTNEFRIIAPSAYITKEAVEKSNTKLLPKGTVVLAITGATLGQVSRLEIDCCANQSVVGLLENGLLPSEFLYLWVKNNIREIIKNQSGGAQQHINKNDVNNSLLLVPCKKILNQFGTTITVVFECISNNCFESETLARTRDSLLPKLMNGEIEA